jgi:hypothetical protein
MLIPCLGLLAVLPAGLVSAFALKGMCDAATAIIGSPGD